MNHLLTVKEVANMLKIHESTVYAWASQGKIPSVTLSRKALRFREKDLQEFIESKLIHLEAHSPLTETPLVKQSKSSYISRSKGQIESLIENTRREVLGCA